MTVHSLPSTQLRETLNENNNICLSKIMTYSFSLLPRLRTDLASIFELRVTLGLCGILFSIKDNNYFLASFTALHPLRKLNNPIPQKAKFSVSPTFHAVWPLRRIDGIVSFDRLDGQWLEHPPTLYRLALLTSRRTQNQSLSLLLEILCLFTHVLYFGDFAVIILTFRPQP